MRSEYFRQKDFLCHGKDCCDGGANFINPRLVELLDELRTRIGTDLILGDVYRCQAYNYEVEGSRNSQHTKGNAAQIMVPENLEGGIDELVKYAENISFDGIGVYRRGEKNWIEVDVRNGGISSGIRWEG